MSADNPLTDAQIRALIHFADHAEKYDGESWFRPDGVKVPTMDILRDLGLIVTQERPSTTVGRITADGIAMLNSMGD